MGALVLAREAQPKGRADKHSFTPTPLHPFTLIAILLIFPLIFLTLLALVYPTTSVDLYDYVFRGRMLAHCRANTFSSRSRSNSMAIRCSGMSLGAKP